jgi:hypothetical protein
MSRLHTLLLLSLLATPAAAQGPIDFSKLRPATDSFVILANGKPVGYETIVLATQGDGFLVTDVTNLEPRMQQRTEVAIAKDGRMRSVTQRGQAMGNEMKIDVAYAAGKATGTAVAPDRTGTIQTRAIAADVPAEAVDDNVLLPLLPGVAWKPAASVTVPVFASGMNMLHQVTLLVVGQEKLQVPAGTFDTYKVDVEGLASPMTLWVNAGVPHRVLKVAPQGTPLEFVAAR